MNTSSGLAAIAVQVLQFGPLNGQYLEAI